MYEIEELNREKDKLEDTLNNGISSKLSASIVQVIGSAHQLWYASNPSGSVINPVLHLILGATLLSGACWSASQMVDYSMYAKEAKSLVEKANNLLGRMETSEEPSSYMQREALSVQRGLESHRTY